jgi:hypothetical protein
VTARSAAGWPEAGISPSRVWTGDCRSSAGPHRLVGSKGESGCRALELSVLRWVARGSPRGSSSHRERASRECERSGEMNKVTLQGNLARDLDYKELGGDKALARGLLAVSRYGRGREGRDLIRIVLWGKQAVNAVRYLDGGSTTYGRNRHVASIARHPGDSARPRSAPPSQPSPPGRRRGRDGAVDEGARCHSRSASPGASASRSATSTSRSCPSPSCPSPKAPRKRRFATRLRGNPGDHGRTRAVPPWAPSGAKGRLAVAGKSDSDGAGDPPLTRFLCL